MDILVKNFPRTFLLAAVCALTSTAGAQDDCKVGSRKTILLAKVPHRIIVQPLFIFGTQKGWIGSDRYERIWTETPLGPGGAIQIDSKRLTSTDLHDLFSKLSPLARIEEDPYILAHGHGRERLLPNDGIFHNKIDLQWWFDRIHAPESWMHGQGDRSVVAAVVDSGIMADHSDLQGNVFVTACEFNVEVNGQSVTCRTGDLGYNAIVGNCSSKALSDHGTQVAGIIGAVGNNGEGGIAGVNWAVTMLSVTSLDEGNGGCVSRAIKALEFVRVVNALKQPRVRVVNLSWGTDTHSDNLERELQRLADDDIVIVASAGNAARNIDRFPVYPASYTSIPTLIAVSSTTRRRFKLADSNYGRTSVHIAAPGQDVRTTGFTRPFPSFSHTSAATPFVAGAIALLASQCPDMSGKQLHDLVLDHSDRLQRLRFRRRVSRGRYLNLEKASKACAVWKHNRNTSQ